MANFSFGNAGNSNPVVKNLIIINVLMVFIQSALFRYGINLSDILGLHYWGSPLFRWWQPFTHLFMHGDPENLNMTLMHIFSNMFALWMFGRILENTFGSGKFLVFYLLCGLGAAACHLGVLTYEFTSFHSAYMKYLAKPTVEEYAHFIRMVHLDNENKYKSILDFWLANRNCKDCMDTTHILLEIRYNSMINEATVGASGAVFGVLFAFGYLYPNTELMLLFPPMPVKAKWFIAGYAVFELVSGIRNSAGDNIAHFAHLGGMLFAFLILRFWTRRSGRRYY
jgi:membrane associated rhomboid family serine protease